MIDDSKKADNWKLRQRRWTDGQTDKQLEDGCSQEQAYDKSSNQFHQ